MKCAELHPKNLLFQTEPIQQLPIAESLLFTARLQVVTVLNQGQLLLKIKPLTSFFYRSCQRNRLMFVTGTGTVTRNSCACVCVDCTAVNVKTAVTSARSVQQLAALYCILQGT